MTYGLNETGFEIKRLPEIKTDLENSFGTVFGAIDTSPESVFGQVIGVLSKPLTDLWEQLQSVYFSQYPDTADGVSLDYAARLTGITRRPSTFSTGIIGLEGAAGSFVPATTQVQTDVTKYVFVTTNDVTINNTNVARLYVFIDKAKDSTEYLVNVNGADLLIISPVGSSRVSIATLIYNKLVADCSAIISVEDYHNGALLLTQKTGSFSASVRARVLGSAVFTATDNAGDYTAGAIVAYLNNGAPISQAFTVDKNTTLAAFAAQIGAQPGVSSSVYDSGAHTIKVKGVIESMVVDVSGVTGLISYVITQAETAVDDLISWYSPIEIQATTTGNLAAPAFSIVEIINPVSGLVEVRNFLAVDAGRDVETDDDLRLRRAQSLAVAGASTVEAIRARILDPVEGVAGITDAFVFENDTDSTVEGLSPHSIKLVANGGDEQAIADFLWTVKAGGIKTEGSISKTVKDSMSVSHTIKFSRPLVRPAWFRLDVYKYSEEGLFPSDGADQIKRKLLEYGESSVSIGVDLIFQRLYPPIYQVPGISSVNLYTALPNLDVEIEPATYADLHALFAWFETLKAVLYDNDTFVVESDGDTVNAALTTAKGSAPVQNDYFKITSVAGHTISYLGALDDVIAPYPAYSQANIAVSGTEVAVFGLDRIFVREP